MRFSWFLRNILPLARIIATFAVPIYVPLANASNLDPYGDLDPSPVVVSPPAPVAGSLTIDGSDVNEVTYNEQSTSTIQWTSSNADLCTLDVMGPDGNAAGGPYTGLSGNISVTLSSPGSYSLTLICSGAPGTPSLLIQKTMHSTALEITSTLSINGSSDTHVGMKEQEALSLVWSSTNAADCSLTVHGPDGSTLLNENQITGASSVNVPSSGGYLVQLTCSAPGRAAVYRAVNVSAEALEILTSLTINGSSDTHVGMKEQEALSLVWSSTNAADCSLTVHGPDGSTLLNENQITGASSINVPSSGGYLVQLTCSAPGRAAVYRAVNVSAEALEILTSLTVNGSSDTHVGMKEQEALSLVWSSTNAADCSLTVHGPDGSTLLNENQITGASSVNVPSSGGYLVQLTCSAPGRAAVYRAVNVSAEALEILTSLTINGNDVSNLASTEQESLNLHWSSSNASDCTLSATGPSGSQVFHQNQILGSGTLLLSEVGNYVVDLSCSGPGRTTVVKSVNISASPFQIVPVLGVNGSYEPVVSATEQEMLNLNWSSLYASECSITATGQDSVPAFVQSNIEGSGSFVLAQPGYYAVDLTCSGPGRIPVSLLTHVFVNALPVADPGTAGDVTQLSGDPLAHLDASNSNSFDPTNDNCPLTTTSSGETLCVLDVPQFDCSQPITSEEQAQACSLSCDSEFEQIDIYETSDIEVPSEDLLQNLSNQLGGPNAVTVVNRRLWPRETGIAYIPYDLQLTDQNEKDLFQEAVQEFNNLFPTVQFQVLQDPERQPTYVRVRRTQNRAVIGAASVGYSSDPNAEFKIEFNFSAPPTRKATDSDEAWQKIQEIWKKSIKGAMLHEMLHVIGFPHQMQVPDRDNHIKVINDCIRPNTRVVDYDKIEPTGKIPILGGGYDYDSIMHYNYNDGLNPSAMFTDPLLGIQHPQKCSITMYYVKDGKAVIDPVRNSVKFPAQSRFHLSQLDIAKVHSAYYPFFPTLTWAKISGQGKPEKMSALNLSNADQFCRNQPSMRLLSIKELTSEKILPIIRNILAADQVGEFWTDTPIDGEGNGMTVKISQDEVMVPERKNAESTRALTLCGSRTYGFIPANREAD